MLQPRNASLEKSQCGLAGGTGRSGRERRAAESFCGFCSLAHQARQLLRFLLSNFWSPALHFTQSIKPLITTLSPFLIIS
ncbi:hypothetical protein O988_04038 [Pseudogymnoascus sp. VKM F-3808]|nr:hypothetical protein O988_04038 [Pseudogymnoascus sp. VKM F-3808]